MILGRTPEGLIKIKTDEEGGGLRAVECACCGCPTFPDGLCVGGVELFPIPQSCFRYDSTDPCPDGFVRYVTLSPVNCVWASADSPYFPGNENCMTSPPFECGTALYLFDPSYRPAWCPSTTNYWWLVDGSGVGFSERCDPSPYGDYTNPLGAFWPVRGPLIIC